jgi:hypothetical protein
MEVECQLAAAHAVAIVKELWLGRGKNLIIYIGAIRAAQIFNCPSIASAQQTGVSARDARGTSSVV